MNLIKAIKSCKEVFVQLQLPGAPTWVKVSKEDVLAHVQANPTKRDEAPKYFWDYHNDSLYLTIRG